MSCALRVVGLAPITTRQTHTYLGVTFLKVYKRDTALFSPCNICFSFFTFVLAFLFYSVATFLACISFRLTSTCAFQMMLLMIIIIVVVFAAAVIAVLAVTLIYFLKLISECCRNLKVWAIHATLCIQNCRSWVKHFHITSVSESFIPLQCNRPSFCHRLWPTAFSSWHVGPKERLET